jgi:hypothetical protein
MNTAPNPCHSRLLFPKAIIGIVLQAGLLTYAFQKMPSRFKNSGWGIFEILWRKKIIL